MSTCVHICADGYWDGAESRALACALAATGDSVVVCDADKRIVSRMERAGVRIMQARFSGLFAPLNLSRILRHLPDGRCDLYLHSPEIRALVSQAIALSGRSDLMLADGVPEPHLSPVVVKAPEPGQVPLLMWLGRITSRSGLPELIEALGRLGDRRWTLKVVGEGDSRTVMPIVRRTVALGIDMKVQWDGYVDDVFSHMDGVSLGVITSHDASDCMAAREFAAAGIPTVCGTDSDALYQLLNKLL